MTLLTATMTNRLSSDVKKKWWKKNLTDRIMEEASDEYSISHSIYHYLLYLC